MRKLKVAVLMGGQSGEREVSLSSGQEVIDALEKTGRYAVISFDPKTDLGQLYQDRKKIDVAFIAMHGAGGEDGTLQGLLELYQIPYTGSGVLASALGMDKIRSLKLFEQAGMRVPEYRVWHLSDVKKELFGLQFPVVVKPNRHGSSLGVSIAKDEQDLKQAIELARKYDPDIIIQDYIEGIELTVGVLGNERLEVLPVVEIVPVKGKFYDYASKYDEGGSKHIIPAKVDKEIASLVQDWAKTAFAILGCRGMARVDFIYGTPVNKVTADLATKAKDLYILEINTIPGLTPTSLLPDAARVAGYDFTELVEKIIHLALEN